MNNKKEILIVGAGPSGLSTAIFLNELGHSPILIDKKVKISKHSKALGINPRSLEIFEPLGITDRLLSKGRKMEAINIWKGEQHIYRNEFSRVNCKFPFMLILSQQESEQILLEEVNRRAIKIDFDSELTNWNKSGDQFNAIINEHLSIPNLDYIIGADGGQSIVRKNWGIDYQGFRYDEQWELFDIELETELNENEGHVRLFPEGGMIMIRIKQNIWRVAGNMKSLLNYLPAKSKSGKIHWESEFRIHHKVAKSLSNDRIALIGDAAHLHSPVGARGMNLGIEDAFIASRLLNQGKLSEYDPSRRPYLMRTVNRINNITMGMTGTSNISIFARNNIQLFKIFFPLIMPRVRKFILGLN